MLWHIKIEAHNREYQGLYFIYDSQGNDNT